MALPWLDQLQRLFGIPMGTKWSFGADAQPTPSVVLPRYVDVGRIAGDPVDVLQVRCAKILTDAHIRPGKFEAIVIWEQEPGEWMLPQRELDRSPEMQRKLLLRIEQALAVIRAKDSSGDRRRQAGKALNGLRLRGAMVVGGWSLGRMGGIVRYALVAPFPDSNI